MKIDKSIRSKTPSVDAYIEELETELTAFEASNIRKLILSIDLLAGAIQENIVLVANGDSRGDSGEVVVTEINKEMIDAFIKLVEKSDKIKGFADTMKAMIPEIVNEVKVNDNHKNGIDPSRNVFEQVQAMNKKNGKTT